MGAYSPMPIVSDALVDDLMAVAVTPTLEALRARGIEYRGLLYAGLMLTPQGPKVIEFNVRFGDPEAQVVLPRVSSDLFELFRSAAAGSVQEAPSFRADACVTVVLAADGYPAAPKKGAPISGLGDDGQLAEPVDGVTVFHAGTSRPDPSGPFLVAGGRVLTVTALGATLAEARARAYEAADKISFEGVQRRSDIAARAAEEESR